MRGLMSCVSGCVDWWQLARLIASLLEDYLGLFLVAPARSQVDVAVMSGTTTLQNLELKPDALDGLCHLLGLPLTPFEVRGCVTRVHVDVPVLKVKKRSAQVTVDGVSVLVGLKAHRGSEGGSGGSAAAAADRAAWLAATEKYKQKIVGVLSPDGDAFDKLLAHVIANANVVVRDVAIRFIDGGVDVRQLSAAAVHDAVRGSVGWTIGQVSITSTDASYAPAVTKVLSVLHKRIAVTAVAMTVPRGVASSSRAAASGGAPGAGVSPSALHAAVRQHAADSEVLAGVDVQLRVNIARQVWRRGVGVRCGGV